MRFQDLLREHRIQFWTEGKYCRPGWIQFHCPFCFGRSNPDKPYAGYHISGNYVNCWACGPHPVGKVITALTGMSWKETKAVLESLDIPFVEKEVRTGTLKLPLNRGPLLKPHRQYLRKREFSPKEIEALWRIEGLGFDGQRKDSDYYDLTWRIFIPVIHKGKTVSWTSRSLVDTGSRYMSASEDEEAISHKTLLYGEDYASTAISIHEGPTDVWRVGPGAVATLGTGFTPAQVLKMARYARRIVCFDSEPAAQQRARKLCSLLEVFPGETLNVQLDAKDAGSATPGEVRKFRKLFN